MVNKRNILNIENLEKAVKTYLEVAIPSLKEDKINASAPKIVNKLIKDFFGWKSYTFVRIPYKSLEPEKCSALARLSLIRVLSDPKIYGGAKYLLRADKDDYDAGYPQDVGDKAYEVSNEIESRWRKQGFPLWLDWAM